MSRTAHKLMASGAKKGYEIEQSLMFNDGDDPYLIRTHPSAGNLKTWTLSFWIKRGDLGALQILYSGSNGSSGTTDYGIIYFDSSDRLGIYYGNITIALTNRVFRDVSAWYHIYIKMDTTQGTASDRWDLKINGVSETSFSESVTPNQNTDIAFNNNIKHYINRTHGGYRYEGYYAEFHNLDGTVKPVTDFAETDSDTGQWIPKETAFTTAEYGTNGFYLKFAGETAKYSPYFDTDVQGIYLSHTNAIDSLGTKNFTTEGWIYPEHDGASGSYDCIWSCGAPQQIYWHKESEMVRVFYQSGGSYCYNNVTSTANVKQGEWCHFAVVRNGTSMTIYTHGVGGTAATSSDSINASSTNAYIGTFQGESGGSQFWGSVYGLRHTIGTARYTSNFTPPTADLTDDIAWNSSSNTGVGFLQVTNSDGTITDAGEGHTITKVGSWSSRYFSPTVTDVGNDSSGKGNDFIPNNLLPSDVMLDTPTNNYPTIDRLTPFNTTISNLSQGNLHIKAVTYSGGYYGNHIATVKVPTSGKWYIETRMAVESGTGNTAWIGVMPQRVAIIPKDGTGSTDGNYAANSSFTGMVTDLIATVDTIRLFRGGSAQATVSSATATSYVIALALDVDNNKVYGGYDSGSGITWLASGNPAAGSNGQAHTFTNDTILQLQVGPNSSSNSNSKQTLNFGQNGTFCGLETAGGNTDGSGEGNFFYAPPSGFKALCSKNLPDPAIKLPTEHINTIIYSGNSSTNNITGMGFAPDLVWLNAQGVTANHKIQDVINGNTKALETDTNVAGEDQSANFTAFASDGFNLAGSTTEYNNSSYTYYAHGWKAGGATTTNVAESGSGTSRINQSWRSTNTDAGFSLIKYVGSNDEISNGQHTKLTHGLSSPPTTLIIKNVGDTDNWHVNGDWMMHSGTVHGFNDFTMALDLDSGYSGSYYIGTTDPDSTYIYLGNASQVNDDGESYICYAWHEVEGYSKFGNYEGNGSTNGPFLYTGFQPQWVMFRAMNVSGTYNWMMFNNALDPDNPCTSGNWADYTARGEAHDSYAWDFLANGLKIRSSGVSGNSSGVSYMYMAFAEAPFKYANAR